MKKLYLLFVLFFLLLPISSKAACNTREKIILSNTVSNVQLTPVFNESTETFNVIVSNLTPNVYFLDVKNKITYPYTANEVTLTGLGPNQSYRLKFYSAIPACYGESITSIYANLPGYNKYYKDPLCLGHENEKVCQKWVNYSYSRETFEAEIQKFDKNEEIAEEKEQEVVKGFYDYLAEIYVKYYYIVLPIIIVVLIVAIIQLNKRNTFF